MPPLAAHGLLRGPFFVVDPSYQHHASVYYPRVVCVQDMEAVHTGQYPLQAYPHTVLARFYGVLRPVFIPMALLHRQRFYARFWGIVEPRTGIPHAARER